MPGEARRAGATWSREEKKGILQRKERSAGWREKIELTDRETADGGSRELQTDSGKKSTMYKRWAGTSSKRICPWLTILRGSWPLHAGRKAKSHPFADGMEKIYKQFQKTMGGGRRA